MLKVYTYAKCDTCRKAVKFLQTNGIGFEEIAIREVPPPLSEIQRMADARGSIRKLFNTSGRDYKALALSEKLTTLSEKDALDLLAGNGNLIKRPFVIDKTICLTGFSESEWRNAFGIS